MGRKRSQVVEKRSGHNDAPRLFLEAEVTVVRTKLMVRAQTIRVWPKSIQRLKHMEQCSKIEFEDLLSEAMRDGFASLKHQKWIEALAEYEAANSGTGAGELVTVDWADAELKAAGEYVKQLGRSQVAFASWSADRYYAKWGPKYLDGLATGSDPKPIPE